MSMFRVFLSLLLVLQGYHRPGGKYGVFCLGPTNRIRSAARHRRITSGLNQGRAGFPAAPVDKGKPVGGLCASHIHQPFIHHDVHVIEGESFIYVPMRKTGSRYITQNNRPSLNGWRLHHVNYDNLEELVQVLRSYNASTCRGSGEGFLNERAVLDRKPSTCRLSAAHAIPMKAMCHYGHMGAPARVPLGEEILA
eukprot:9351278-Pyramimonas_sp.AAC.1